MKGERAEKFTMTITFGDQAENHVGMKKIGSPSSRGFSVDNLIKIRDSISDKYIVELYHLELDIDHDPAAILIIRGAVQKLVDIHELTRELTSLEWDKKALMYGRVVNKKARHNLCFGDKSEAPNYAAGQGRVVGFSDVPTLSDLRRMLPEIFGADAKDLVAEGNLYYDIKKCGIGFHGDSERRKVIALRLGAKMPLVYQWFFGGSPRGKPSEFTLGDGDMYIMSEKAVGTDWKKKKVPTLRHAAGYGKWGEYS